MAAEQYNGSEKNNAVSAEEDVDVQESQDSNQMLNALTSVLVNEKDYTQTSQIEVLEVPITALTEYMDAENVNGSIVSSHGSTQNRFDDVNEDPLQLPVYLPPVEQICCKFCLLSMVKTDFGLHLSDYDDCLSRY